MISHVSLEVLYIEYHVFLCVGEREIEKLRPTLLLLIILNVTAIYGVLWGGFSHSILQLNIGSKKLYPKSQSSK